MARFSVVALALAAFAAGAAEQDYPTRPVKIISPTCRAAASIRRPASPASA